MRAILAALRALALVIFGVELLAYVIRRYETRSSGEAPELRRGIANVVGAFFGQCAAAYVMVASAPLAFWWPFPRSPGSRQPLVLVHGYLGTRAGFFWLAWRLRRDGFATVAAVNYRSFGGDVHAAARRLSAAIERLVAECGSDRVDIVAHSLGGLVARAYIRDYGGAARVRRLVTLGTPHRGTKTAALAVDSLGRSMLPGSRLLTELGADDPVPGAVAVTSIFSTFDARVLPWRNACYPGAANVELDGIGHDALLFSPKAYSILLETLGSSS